MTQRWRAALSVLALVACAERANAQSDGPVLRPNHLMVSAGLVANGGYPIGDRNAEIRANAIGTPPPFTLFRAESELNRASGFDARVAWALTPHLALEVGGTLTRPELAVTITQDAEGAAPPVVAEEISQYTVDVGGVLQLPWIKLGSRARPYVTGGGGYLRQLHEDRLLAETGATMFGGGGVRYWLRGGSATARALGVRADIRYVYRTRGIDFEDKRRGYPVISVLGFVGL